MASGIDRRTGKPLSGWPYTQQQIEDVISTLIETRVMLRQYGSNAPKMIDRSMSPRSLLAYYVAIATGIHNWVPNFRLTEVGFEKVSPDGQTTLRLAGDHFPNGHHGDFSLQINRAWELAL